MNEACCKEYYISGATSNRLFSTEHPLPLCQVVTEEPGPLVETTSKTAENKTNLQITTIKQGMAHSAKVDLVHAPVHEHIVHSQAFVVRATVQIQSSAQNCEE